MKRAHTIGGGNGGRNLHFAAAAVMESLEERRLLSGGNYLDEIQFGSAASESAHSFDSGVMALPPSGTGTDGLTYREIAGPASGTSTGANNEVLTFTMNVDPFKQNYLTVRLWGSDTTPSVIYLYDPAKGYSVDNYDESTVPWLDWQVAGGQPAFPGRFYYDTTPIPLSWTQGQKSVSLTLNSASDDQRYNNHTTIQLAAGQVTRPIYAAFTTTEPDFTPASGDPTGAAPTATTTTLGTITASQAQSILLAERSSIYGTNGYYNAIIARQVLSTSTGAPAEAVGLDLFASPFSYTSSAASVWDAQIAKTGLPDELLSVLGSSYLLPALSGDTSDPNYYHSSSVLTQIISAMDGSTYEQGSDGGFPTNEGWVGLTAAGGQRTAAGGNGFLEGIDVQVFGDTIVSLLNDPSLPSGTNFKTYLGQSFDANLNGSSMVRAYAYERMLFNSLNYLRNTPGGTSSQNLFQIHGAYADQVGLEKLQALYPNAAYPALPVSVGLNMAEQVLGTAPTTYRGGYDTHFALTAEGLGKDGSNNLEGSYDRGYGQWFPELALQMAKLAEEDPGVSTTADHATVARIENVAKNTVATYDQFLSSNLQATTSGSTTTYAQSIAPDDTLSNRNPNNANNVVYDVDTQFAASNPGNTNLYSSLAARSTYLQVESGRTPEPYLDGQTQNSNLQYLREVPDYEASINALVNNTPSTTLPAESSSSNFAWADVQGGVVSFQNSGERVLMDLNYRGAMGSVDNVVRIHDTTATADRVATVYMPWSGATLQSDGNVSGNYNSAWVDRYGNYLVVLNRAGAADTVTLPLASGNATDLLTGNSYPLGGNVSVAAGQAVILYLGNATVSAAAALQPAAPTSEAPATLVAGPATATLLDGQSLTLADAAFDANGLPVTTAPNVTWTLQSGIGTVSANGIYTAPQTGTGTATIIGTYDGLTSSAITFTILPFAPPGNDIGTVGKTGSDSYASGTYTAVGAGAGLAGTADAFHFVSSTLSGDLTVSSQITSTSAVGGVMIRGSNAANAAFAAAVYTPGSGVKFTYRTTAGGSVASSSTVSKSSGIYLRVTRGTGPDGATYSAAYSSNGSAWTTLGSSQTIAINAIPVQAYVGLAVTSRSTSATGTATFTNVAVTRAANEYPSISSLTSGVHGSNVWYQFNVTDTANSGAATLTIADQVLQAPVNASPYHFQGTNFYPGSAGTYVVQVNVVNSDGLFVSQNVTLNVAQVVTTIASSPPSPIVQTGASQQLTALGYDQFGNSMPVSSPSWSVPSAGGTITVAGVYTASSTPGVYAITVSSGGVIGTADDEVVQPPAVQSTLINAGAAQRSLVTSLTYTFSQAVTLGSSAFTIALHPSSADGSTLGTLPTPSWSSADGGITWIVTFSGAGVVNGSIADGMYDLTVNAQQVQNSSFQTMSTSATTSFLRLFGDYDGNGAVNGADYARFRAAYGSSVGQNSYLALFDYDNNGAINGYDYAQFRARYGLSLVL